jgi:hypothetical protein
VAKNYFIAALLNLGAQYSFARHCPWDGSCFIMLDVKSSLAVKLQKIYLLNSTIAKGNHSFTE